MAKSIYSILEDLEIAYEKYEHPAVYTVEEAEKHGEGIRGGRTKNLFMRNKKGDKHYLVVTEASARVDVKQITRAVGESRLSFASPERLMSYLGVTPGSVSPFGLIHDKAKEVVVLLDKELLRHSKLGFHPNKNTETLVITTEDFEKFLRRTGNPLSVVDLQSSYGE